MIDAKEHIPVRFFRPVLAPRTALLVLMAACNLYLVHAVVLFLLASPPYSGIETVLIWATGFAGLVLLSFGGTVALAMLRQLRASDEALRHSEAGLRLFAAEAPAMLWTTDRELRLHLLRGSEAPDSGATPTSVALMPAHWRGALVHEHFGLTREAPLVRAHERALAGEAAEFDMEWGGAIWRGRVEPLGDGDVAGAVGVAVDVSASRRAEAELKETRQQLHAMIDASPLGIIAAAPDGRVELWNRAATAILGWTEAEVLGQADPSVPEEAREEHRALRSQLLDGEAVTELETRRRSKSGELVDVSISAAPVRDAEGVIAGTVAVVADITQRRQAAAERERLEAQLRHAMRMEAVGRLAGGVAHDFNNLLTAIKGHTELVLDRAADDLNREELEEIGRAADRAAVLTRQMLAFSRRQRVEATVVNLNDIVLRLRKMLVRVIGEDVALETVLDPELGPVRADIGQIEQVLVNLAVNARDAMPGGGELLLSTENRVITEEDASCYPYHVEPGPYAVLSVADNGAGMSEDTLSSIFEPFFTTKPPGVGTGLGLAQAYGIVKQHDGYIWADSEPGSGSVFRVYIPRALDTDMLETHDVPRRDSAVPTVLVVDDEEAVRRLVRKVLERDGYAVLEADSGTRAHQIARDYEGVIHLACTDVQLPDMSGPEIMQGLEAHRRHLPVLVMSGYDRDTLQTEGLLGDVTAFLEKPFTPDQLVTAVHGLLSRLAEPTEPL